MTPRYRHISRLGVFAITLLCMGITHPVVGAQQVNMASPVHAAPPAPQKNAKIPQDKLPKKVKLEGSTYIAFPAKDGNQKIQGGGFLLLPPNLVAGKDKVPVVIIMHGNGGVVPSHEYVYARELAKMGVAAFVVDSFVPRGIDTVYDNQKLIRIRDFTRDAFEALYALRKEPRVDTRRAGILGFSKGAVVSLYTAMQIKRKDLKVKNSLSFKAHYAFYPGCAFQYRDVVTTGAPITMFLGEKDEYTGAQPCAQQAAAFKAANADIKTIIYDGAGHGWDFQGTTPLPNAEIYKNCQFEQQADNTWSEKKSGIAHIKNLSGPLYSQAMKACMSRGTQLQESPAAKTKAMDDFKALVRQQLLETKPAK